MANTAIVPALKQYASLPAVENRLKETLKTEKDKKLFLSTVYSLASDNYMLANCTPESIFKAAITAAEMGLSINPISGYAYVVPYGKEAKFMPGYKGIIQLCIDTNLYERINATPVYSDEISNFNPLTNEFSFKEGFSLESERFTGGQPIGFYSTFELKNGFKSAYFMTRDNIIEYAKQYSQAYKNDIAKGKKNSPWSSNFEAMALKTVLKQLLSKFGPKNNKLELAFTEDAESTEVEATPVKDVISQTVESIPEAEVVNTEAPGADY